MIDVCMRASRALVNYICQLVPNNKKHYVLFSLIGVLIPLLPMAQANTAGFVTGELAVSPGGAAKYNIPIVVPPGTASMQPNLSLKYNSQGKNGLLGVGWSLDGFSSITRCQATIDQDGFNGGIKFDDNDRFCLDGKRLVAVNGALGADGTEYRTEIDSFAKIVSYGQSGNGPAYWKAWTKSGRIIEYGNTADSSLEAQGNVSVLRWSVNKISDVVGNYLSVSYVEDPAVGERRPDRINYAGNGNTGATPQLSVRFGYEDRTDIIRKYINGSKTTTSKRLSSIKTYVNEDLVKEYRLAYEYGNDTKRSRITNVTECDAQNCKPGTTLTWQDRSSNVFQDIETTTDSTKIGQYNDWYYSGDFNGNGRTDLVRFYGENYPQLTLKVFLAREDGGLDLLSETDVTNDILYFTTPNFAQDYNGDGITDLYGWASDYQNIGHKVFFFSEEGTIEQGPVQPISEYALCGWNYTGDVNGDGKADIVVVKCDPNIPTNTLVTYISQGDGTFEEVPYTINTRTDIGVYDWAGFNQGHPEILVPGDFNGDGLADFVTFSGVGDRLLVLISKSDGTYEEKLYWTQTPYYSFQDNSYLDPSRLLWPGDYNGDGITDLFGFTKDNSGLVTYLGKGDGSFEEVFQSYNEPNYNRYYAESYGYLVQDINGDGLTDVMYKGHGVDRAFISKGDGTYTTNDDFLGVETRNYMWPGDYNGDGQFDLISKDFLWDPSVYTSFPKYRVVVSDTAQSKPDLLITITNGLGDQTNVSYKPLTDNSIYTKGTDAVAGVEKDIQAPAYVVTKVDIDDGVGGQNSITYKYGGLKASINGRGLLGFAWREETNQQTGIVKRTEYRQDFPYIGRQSRNEIRSGDNTLLSESMSTFAEIVTHDLATGPDVHFPYVSQLIEKKYELNGGALVSTAATTTSYDNYGNPTQVDIVVAGDPWNEYKTTVNTYSNDEINWHIGNVTQTTVIFSNPQGTEVRNVTYAYDGNGLLIQELIEPNNIDLRQQTDYEYDDYGNQTLVTVSGAGVEPRTTSTTYDSQGRFPVSLTNALGHTEAYTHDSAFGIETSLTGPNNLETNWQYDSFGRKIREDRADGTWTTITYGHCGVTDCSVDAPAGAVLHTTVESSGSSPATTFYDKLNREIRVVKTGFDGTMVYEDTEYNAHGQVSRKSQPYFKGDTAYWTSHSYDAVNRVVSVARPSKNEPNPDPVTGSIATTYSFNGLSVTETNSLGQTTVRVKDQAGNLHSVTDSNGNITTYSHSPTGNLLSTTDPAGNVVTISYNARGWKASMNDPDMGVKIYQYNIFGELVAQTDAEDQTMSMVYDKLGRMVERTEPEGTTSWIYDTAANGIGKLAQVNAPEGFQQTVTYDSLGRANTTSTTINSTTLSLTTDYDEFGRVSRTTRPEGFVVENSYNAQGYLDAVYSPSAQIGDYDSSHIRFLLDTAINDAETALSKAQEVADSALYYQQKAEEYLQLSGTPDLDPDLEAQLQSIAAELDAATDTLNTQAVNYIELAEQLTEVAEQLFAREQILLQRYAYSGENDNNSHYQAMVNDSANVYFWRAKSRDAAGRLTSSVVGNGLETNDIYDQATGQLTDIISGFGYATPIRQLNYVYNSLNHVTSRADQVQGMSETFEYDSLNRLTSSYVNGNIAGVNYNYTVTYSYDALGNITNKSDVGNYIYGNQGRTTGNAGPHALISAGADHTDYQYDLNGNMVQGGGRNIKWSSFNKPIEFKKDGIVKASFTYDPDRSRYLKIAGDTTTYYLGKAYERVETVTGTGTKLEHKYFIYAGGQLVGIHVKTTDQGEARPDETRYLHRDSLGSIDTITDGQGRIIDRMSYEAFGARRGGDWRAFAGVPYIPAFTNRGYTGHEHVDEMDLIHMNGRVYDPELGRFISADPFIQLPYDPQSYNRYSYVLNNPLNYTDPSGYNPSPSWTWEEFEQGSSWGEWSDWGNDFGSSFTLGFDSDIGTGGDGGFGSGLDNGYDGYDVGDRLPDGSTYLGVIEVNAPRYEAVDINWGSYGGYGDIIPIGAVETSWTSMAHDALDMASYVPIVGNVASVIDGAIYAMEGNWGLATFAFAGVLGPVGKLAGKFGKASNKIPWSSGNVKSAASTLSNGAKSVTVKSRSQAEELFLGLYQGKGFRNSSGFDGVGTKQYFGSKKGTYHWDDALDASGRVIGHGPGRHGGMKHLQIHDEAGQVIRIFFE